MRALSRTLRQNYREKDVPRGEDMVMVFIRAGLAMTEAVEVVVESEEATKLLLEKVEGSSLLLKIESSGASESARWVVFSAPGFRAKLTVVACSLLVFRSEVASARKI